MGNDNVKPFRRPIRAALVTLEIPEFPEGPFTVTVTGPGGKMWEVEFPDYEGASPPDSMAMGTGGPGMPQLVVNLLTGALRVFAGFVR